MYHYGLTIKEYREAKGLTQAQLAENWPKSNGDTGVKTDYVSLVETGRRKIEDLAVIRKICDTLDIPLWKMGLSDYNPFEERGFSKHIFVDMEALSNLIQDIWYIRVNMPMDIVERKIISLSNIFNRLLSNNPTLLENRDFLILYAQVKRLEEVIYTEKHDYKTSLKYSYSMLEVAEKSGDAATKSIAMARIGVELLRDENRKALDFLEQARDLSFLTSSKEVAAYCYTFLARGYATFRDEKRFIQTINTAITLADSMKGLSVTTKDHVYHAYSAILEEKSNGLILFGRGKEAFDIMHEIDTHAAKENNTYLKMWLPLDYSQSLMLMGEIEASVKWLEAFYKGIRDYTSKRIHSTVEKHLRELDSLGYADLAAVKSFREMYREGAIG